MPALDSSSGDLCLNKGSIPLRLGREWFVARVVRPAIGAGLLLAASCAPQQKVPVAAAALSETTQTLAKAALPWMDDALAVVVSPDGTQYLRKTYDAQGKTVVSLQTIEGRLISSFTASWPLLMSFRPGTTQISFAEDDNGNRRFQFKLWDSVTGIVSVPEVPVMADAARWFRWSADGRSLLLIATNSERLDDLWRIDFGDGTVPHSQRRLYSAKSINCVNWFSDNLRCVAVSETALGGVYVIDTITGDNRFVPVLPGALLRDAVIAGDRVIFRCSGSDGRFDVRRLDLATGKSEVISEPGQSVYSVAALPGGEIVFGAEGPEGSLLTQLRPDGFRRRLGLPGGRNSFAGYSAAAEAVLLVRSSPTKPEAFQRVSLNGDSSDDLLRLVAPENWAGNAPTVHAITAHVFPNLKVLLWKAPIEQAKGIAIYFPVRRTFGPSENYESMGQFALRHGYDFVAFDFPPAPVGARGWDLEVRHEDVLAAIDVIGFAKQQLKRGEVPLMAVAESNATVYAAKVVQKNPRLLSALFLRGVTRSVAAIEPVEAPHLRLALLQGENDPFPIDLARSAVERVLKTEWTEFPCVLAPGEGHVIRKPHSKALRAAMIVELGNTVHAALP